MWWCCGKRGKDQPGCRFSKHESKDDEDEDEEKQDEKQKQKQLKYMKCMCCKQMGHTIELCHQDPNLKTKAVIESDFDRILKIKDFRHLFADTVITTTHFLKKCIKVPKVQIRALYDEPTVGVTVKEAKVLIDRQYKNVFKRGVMNFEDYNYDCYNKYILIDPNKISKTGSLDEPDFNF